MLHSGETGIINAVSLTDPQFEHSASESLGMLWRVIWRHTRLVCALILFFITVPAFYIYSTPSVFTATAVMVIDTQKAQLFPQQNSMSDFPIDGSSVQTEVEILKSDNVGLSLIRDLHLTDDPEFAPHGGFLASAIGVLKERFSATRPSIGKQTKSSVLAALRSQEKVARVGLTYAIAISFSSTDPDKAARIANAIVDAYVSEKLNVKYAATRRAATWLQERIEELRTQANAADQAVVDFKKTYNINAIDAGGKLMNEQQLSEVNTQLTFARASTAEAKAKFDRISDIMKQAVPDASISDALNSAVIVRLRSQYLELASKEAIWSKKYGPNHQATAALRSQMLELQHNIADEMNKIAEGYKSDYQIALARQEALTQSLASSVVSANNTNQAQIQLRELVSEADSLRNLRENFTKQYMEMTRQESFPINEARMISPADESISLTAPKTRTIMATALIAGLFVSVCAAFLLETFDHGLRSKRDVADELRLTCLAVLPEIRRRSVPVSVVQPDSAGRKVSGSHAAWRYVLDEPFSEFTEGLRGVKVAVDLDKPGLGRVIGFTSSLPGEGKSTASVNMARLLAHSGNKVLLVDADLRNPALTKGLTAHRGRGLVDVAGGNEAFTDVIWTDPESGLFFLPIGISAAIVHTSEFIGSQQLRNFFAIARDHFDYIIVDLPPLAPIVDARAAVGFVDKYVFIARWGVTKVGSIKAVLAAAPEVLSRTIGVVLNMADVSKIGRYDPYHGHKSYEFYYRSWDLSV